MLASLPVVIIVFRRFAQKTTPLIDAARLAARIIGIVALTLGLTTPQISREVDRVNLLYLVDVSDSAGTEAENTAVEYIDLTVRQKAADDTFGVVVFGADASPEILPTTVQSQITIESLVDTSGTNIEAALYRAVSLFPESGENRIVLLSDGNQTAGDAERAAQALAGMGIGVFPVQLELTRGANEVLVQHIDVPQRINAGQVHDVTVLIQSEEESQSALYIFKNGVYMGEDVVQLSPGANRFTYESRIDESGVHIYEVYIQPESDTVQENNQHRASIKVQGEPAVLYVTGDEGPSEPFLSGLNVQSISFDAITPLEFPTNLQSLLVYDALIFDNVPAFDLSIASMELVERYVRDAGGGFLMLGGDQSFGIGGYFSTPVEKALPVDMDVTSSMNTPSLALFMVIDKSGSMGDTIASGETKLDLVKEAVIASIEVLNPYYTVGLLAFDSDYEWTVLPTSAGQRQQIVSDMQGLAPGGGTNLYPALEEAYQRLQTTAAAVKHVLVLSDGLTDEGEFEDLAATMRDDRITLSTVSIGGDADRDLLSMMAEIGGGRSYFTDDIKRIPRIFASESIIVSRGLIVEESFIPTPGVPSEITEGIDIYSAPPVHGFVLAYPKSGARQVLLSFGNNPLLSTWRYGLGKSAAYTSDFRGRWGRDLVVWEEFPTLAAQLIRWLRRPPGSGELSVAVDESGELRVDAIDVDGNFINDLDLEAIVALPEGQSVVRALEQTAPGLYTLDFDTGQSGEYYLTLFGSGAGREFAPDTHVLSIPYAAEYKTFRPDLELLEEIASSTGGKLLSSAGTQADGIYARSDAAQPDYTDGWRPFIIAALLLLLIDVALRQIVHSERYAAEEERSSLIGRVRSEERARRRMTYEELLEHLSAERKRESEKKDMAYWFGSQKKSPDTTLRLYLARKRKG